MKTYPSILFYTVLFVSFASLSSCQNSLTDVPQTDQYFPNRVGDRWTYAVSDSSGQVVDTLWVTVKRKTILPDGAEARVWQYVTSDSSYNRYVTEQADSVFFYSDSTAQHITEKIVTPYKVGAWWYSPNTGYNIDKKDTVEINGNSKILAFRIRMGGIYKNSSVIPLVLRVDWITPYLGIVKERKYSNNKNPRTILYNLHLMQNHLK